ncbi:lactate utilization protein B/C [Gallibacterium genomosp. 2]|uniref:Lactate utilization protein B/C n=2 Tax=Gallibacterium TaxID=155493 RepID=A0A0A2XIT0_9PAST|nr:MULTISPECIES: lactate utilization protein C [Gallibacterium]KGQ30897.1 lactate utilization protein B/C [Gallibacterium genomosp. 2]KGQ36873.1 lactate utilization protein B/C [Gallibacterium genomosp. 1]KGQ50280.1 lactate utilization protein B/C [Gallibacterium anatis 10672-6]OBX01490.1 lactate utilization protein B/C [Gallibacterium genomosp. 1]
MLDQQNRSQFLSQLAKQLGRPLRTEVVGTYPKVNDYPETRFTDLSEKERYQAFINTAKDMLVDVVLSTAKEAHTDIIKICEKYNGGNIVLNNDERLKQYQITQAVQQQYNTHIWAESSNENLEFSKNANIGIVFAEYGLIESGGIVLYSSPNNGRSVSLLPPISVVVLKRSTIQPRITQIAKVLHQKAEQGERMPSCINIISGPSATADIELVKVVGVHGPIKVVYLLIDDVEK